MIDTTLADFNAYVRQFGSRVFLVAGRIFDLAPERWEVLACLWYQKNGLLELPADRYIGKLPNGRDAMRYHSVDSIVLAEPAPFAGIGQHIYDGWMARKAELAKMRGADPVIIIAKPPPAPPKPVELPPKEEPAKKNPNPNIVRFGVWWGIIATVAGAVALFYPPAKPFVTIVVAFVKAILTALGA